MMLAAVLAATVKIGVFGLFHPVELDVEPVRGGVLVVESTQQTHILEGAHTLRLRSAARVTGRDGAESSFILSVPGKIRREYRGRLEVRESSGHLIAIVEMDRETAVASIVAAESPGEPLEARKAQALVARSFLVASTGRHDGFDFCDTTHCQFLREVPANGSGAQKIQASTRGLVLEYEGRVIPTLYSADCGGHTRTLAEAGWRVDGYPYFGVECPVHGNVSGHRLGMCQVGSVYMARHGSTFREILEHYFPAATIGSLEQ
jgi:peptidoglycan hydrolase-like amidase